MASIFGKDDFKKPTTIDSFSKKKEKKVKIGWYQYLGRTLSTNVSECRCGFVYHCQYTCMTNMCSHGAETMCALVKNAARAFFSTLFLITFADIDCSIDTD